MNQFLIIIRGAPASGKSTLSKNIRNYDKRIVWLKTDNLKDFFADDATPAMEYVNGAVITLLNYLLEQEFSVIMDGIFQETDIIDKAIEITTQKNIKSFVYQLKCPLEILITRDQERPGVKENLRKPIGEEAIVKIFGKLENNKYPDAEELDTGSMPINICLDIILKKVTDLTNE